MMVNPARYQRQRQRRRRGGGGLVPFLQCLLLMLLLVVLATTGSTTSAQQQDGDYADYQDYAGDYGSPPADNLYHDYATRQQEKELGAAAGGGVGLGKLVLGSALSWFAGAKFHSGRTAKKLKAKFQKEQKQLYSQYYNDVYKLTEQNQDLQLTVQQLQEALRQTEAKHELEAMQRDYDEFKQPDIDGDDRISRAEFNMYVKNYLSNYPGLSEKDYPKFEDFDHDGDGYVSFQEYSQQMALQAQKAETDSLYGSSGSGGSGSSSSAKKAQAYADLYKDSKKASASGTNFEGLYNQLRA